MECFRTPHKLQNSSNTHSQLQLFEHSPFPCHFACGRSTQECHLVLQCQGTLAHSVCMGKEGHVLVAMHAVIRPSDTQLKVHSIILHAT